MKIAISGRMKSGKTTLAKALDKELYGHHITSFARPIREALKALGITKEQHPDLYRAGAQYIGTDLIRAHDPDWWVNYMDRKVRTDSGIYHGFIIDDMRFENEYDWCKANGFILVRLDISEQMQYNRRAEEGTFNHPSETGLDHIVDWDVWCSENTTVAERVQAVLLASQRGSLFQTGSMTAAS